MKLTRIVAPALLWGMTLPMLHAADLIVEENGVLPNYSTIQAAVTAASPGDRIFVKNKAGNVPYAENVTVDKPLELLPFTAGGTFYTQGDYTVVPNGTNFSVVNDRVRILGMTNVSGNIISTTTNSTGDLIWIQVHGCHLMDGGISFLRQGYFTEVSGNWLESGGVGVYVGKVIGNLMDGSIFVGDDSGTPNPVGNTIYIVGNRITTDTGSFVGGAINWTHEDNYCFIANNYIRTVYTLGAIRFNLLRMDGGQNIIHNNTIETSTSGSTEGIVFNLSLTTDAVVSIQNNLFHNEGGSSCTGIEFGTVASTQLPEVHFNVFEGWDTEVAVSSGSVSQSGNTTATSSMNPDNITGISTDSSVVDSGNPGSQFTDLDLTQNDRGVAGGSFNVSNFFPILTGATRVFFVNTPRTVVTGNTLNAEADALDR